MSIGAATAWGLLPQIVPVEERVRGVNDRGGGMLLHMRVIRVSLRARYEGILASVTKVR